HCRRIRPYHSRQRRLDGPHRRPPSRGALRTYSGHHERGADSADCGLARRKVIHPALIGSTSNSAPTSGICLAVSRLFSQRVCSLQEENVAVLLRRNACSDTPPSQSCSTSLSEVWRLPLQDSSRR